MTYTTGPWARFDTPDYAEIHPKGACLPVPIALVGKPDDADLIATTPELLDALDVCVSMLVALEAESGRDIPHGEEDPFRMGEWFEADDKAFIAYARNLVHSRKQK